MQSKLKWLFVPPAIALVLFLGPLQAGSKNETEPQGNGPATAVSTPERTPTEVGSALPTMPSMWQISSTLIGVLLLGAVGIAVLKRAQQSRPGIGGTDDIVRLRQSLRLTPKSSVHALEFDGALLLVGESDGALAMLHSGSHPAELDERTIAARDDTVEDDDDGVVLRDMVIPRSASARTTAPTPPARRGAQPSATKPAHDATAAAKLAQFKNLLVKAGSAR